MEARAASAESAGRSVTPQTVPSARGAQTRGQRVRGRGLRPARAEPAQRWLGAGRRPSGSRRPRPPDPKSSRAPGRAARRPRAVSRDAGRWGSRVRSCVCPGPLQRGGVHASPEPEGPSHRWRQLWPGLGTLPPPADGRCAPDTAALPFWGQPCVPAAGPCRGTEVLPSRRLSPSCAGSDGGRVRFFELAPPVPGPPTSRPLSGRRGHTGLFSMVSRQGPGSNPGF